MKSGDGATHNLYWIVPADTTATCTAWPAGPWNPRPPWHTGDIQTMNNFGVASPVNLMMYTPCNADVENQSNQIGQIFAGMQVNIDNKFDLQFKPLPVFGVDKDTLPLISYDVDISYKREIQG